MVYLGIPLGVGPRLREFWQEILDKFWNKVTHWTCRWLSFVGKLTLLKVVVQALPIYRCFMQVAPSSFVKEFDSLSQQFLWSRNIHASKWSLIKWDKVCMPKQVGGLGLRFANVIGQVLAMKLYWRWCTC